MRSGANIGAVPRTLVPAVFVALYLFLGGCQLHLSMALELHHLPPLKEKPVLFNQELGEFDELSEVDAKLHLINLFAAMDSGLDHDGEPVGGAGNGVLDHGELALRISRVELDRQSEDAYQNVLMHDRDNDELLDASEAIDALSESVGKDIAQLRFASADRNKDGWLSVTEAQAFFHPDSSPHMFPLLVTEIMQALDLNGNMLLDREEVSFQAISSYMHRSSGTNGTRSALGLHSHRIPFDLYSLPSHYSALDKDGDGHLSAKELVAFVDRVYQNRINAIVDDIFSHADTNHDGELTPEEVWAAHELFIGSHGVHSHAAAPSETLVQTSNDAAPAADKADGNSSGPRSLDNGNGGGRKDSLHDEF